MAPGLVRSTAPASNAVVVDPLRPWPRLVDHEHAVGVAVERQAEIETARDHTRPQVALVRRLERIGGVVRERAVEFGVHHLEFDSREPLHHRWDHETTHAVGGVGDDLHLADVGRIDEGQHMVGEAAEQVLLGARATLGRGPRCPPVEDVLSHPLHLGETGVDTDRTGPRQAELDAVVPGRVVRRREHRPGSVEAARRRST